MAIINELWLTLHLKQGNHDITLLQGYIILDSSYWKVFVDDKLCVAKINRFSQL